MNTATFGQLIGEAGRVRLAAIREQAPARKKRRRRRRKPRPLSLNECANMLEYDTCAGR